jgi:hypothetical protein
LGTLVYNEILVIPFWGFDKNTKVAIEKRKKEEQGRGNYDAIESKLEQDYISQSPHAIYDYNRNKRALEK